MIPTVGFLSVIFSILTLVHKCRASAYILLFACKLTTNPRMTLKAIDLLLLLNVISLRQVTEGCVCVKFSRRIYSPPATSPWAKYLAHRLKIIISSLADLGGVPGARLPYGTQFFRFRIHFHQKVPTSEVHAPPLMGARPPYGKSWIRHCSCPHNSDVIFICSSI